jgi:hypothetical protein
VVEQNTSSLNNFDTNKALVNQNFINNMSYRGVTPTANTTMFIKYRVGGGGDTNLGPNVLTAGDNQYVLMVKTLLLIMQLSLVKGK